MTTYEEKSIKQHKLMIITTPINQPTTLNILFILKNFLFKLKLLNIKHFSYTSYKHKTRIKSLALF